MCKLKPQGAAAYAMLGLMILLQAGCTEFDSQTPVAVDAMALLSPVTEGIVQFRKVHGRWPTNREGSDMLWPDKQGDWKSLIVRGHRLSLGYSNETSKHGGSGEPVLSFQFVDHIVKYCDWHAGSKIWACGSYM